MARSVRCVPPEVLLEGRATAKVTAVPEAWTLSFQQAQSAPAHAALNLPPPPANAADSDAQDFSNTQTNLAKPRDSLIVDARYEIAFEVVGGCPPFQVSVATSGEVVSQQSKLPRAGRLVLTKSTIFTGDAFPGRQRGTLDATFSFRDCAGNSGSCMIQIPEP